MKKLTMIALILIVAISSIMAGVVSSYRVYGVDYDVDVTETAIKINTYGEGLAASEHKVVVERSAIPDFISFLRSVHSKHSEWYALSRENNIKDMAKIMPTVPSRFSVKLEWKFGSDMQFSGAVPLIPFYTIDGDIQSASLVALSEPVSSSNQFIGFGSQIIMIFLAPDELLSLINALDEKKIYEHMDKLKRNRDLFK
ncbi:MAG: hypothetical protein PHX79_05230 [Sphaerochaetaceae bacterium]|nr:hypothetical protein [Sphaerochaetaceae bacterium]